MTSSESSRSTPAREVLESWKEIAAYLGRSVRAVQLWEKDENLPVHRHQHDKHGTVFAYRDEIDRWREGRSTPPAPISETPLPDAKPRSGRGLRVIAAVAIAVVVFVGAWFLLRRPSALDPKTIHSIAVLPFRNSDPPTEHWSDGLTDLLIDDLAALADLRIMARSSVFHFKGKPLPPAQVGKELNVDAVITGDIRREAGRHVVRAELIDVTDGAQIWSGRYETTTAELPLVQQRMVSDLSRTLRGDAAVNRAASQRYTENPEAYEQHLLGLREWSRRSSGGRYDQEALPRSVKHFQRAIELDGQFAAPYAGLANAYGVMISRGDISPAEGTARVLAAARKALELDPNNAEAYTSLATASFRSLWDFEGADRDYRRAIALSPSYATAHQWYAEYLMAMGRFADARKEIELAYGLDPLSGPITNARCWNRYYARQYEEAIAFANEVAARDPGRVPRQCVNTSMTTLGTLKISAFIDALQKEGRPGAENARAAYQRGGARGFYRARLEFLLRSQQDAAFVPIARQYVILGELDPAFAFLEKAYERRDSQLSSFHIDPGFDAIRADPRFRDLARRVGLPASALDAVDALAAKTPFRGMGE